MFELHAFADDPDWRGWWGDEPPFHAPVFVLTHSPRPKLEMAGGTTFTSLPRRPARRSARRWRPRAARTRGSAAVRPSSASSSRPDWSTGSTSPSSRSCSAAASGSGRPPRVRGRLHRDVGNRPERDHAPDVLALNVRRPACRREPALALPGAVMARPRWLFALPYLIVMAPLRAIAVVVAWRDLRR